MIISIRLLIPGMVLVASMGMIGCSSDDGGPDPGPDPEAELTARIRAECGAQLVALQLLENCQRLF